MSSPSSHVCDNLRKVAGATTEKVVRVSLAALKHLTEGEVCLSVCLVFLVGGAGGAHVCLVLFGASLAQDTCVVWAWTSEEVGRQAP